ncbi:hypothetical protein MUK42_18357 [Musa troglodytarum]|uniref:Uncharacterized protein n=1 Tax=Musa troglodytarum TaxID=320322 RepID=A0A9E7FQE6_9LILI|nr:hypothetical protein MUK42_18357 [Musa troglodytarum]
MSSSNKTPSPLGSSSTGDDLSIAFCPLFRRRRCAERSTASCRKVVEVSSSPVGSESFETPRVPWDVVQMKEAHDCSSVVTSW